MDELEGKIGEILSDPDALSSIFAMVKNLGLSAPGSPEDGDPSPAQEGFSEPEQAATDSLFDAIPFSLIQMLSQAGKVDTKQAALFNALKPFLKPDRREKIDKALRIARLSHVAGFAIKNWEHKGD